MEGIEIIRKYSFYLASFIYAGCIDMDVVYKDVKVFNKHPEKSRDRDNLLSGYRGSVLAKKGRSVLPKNRQKD